LQNLSPVRTTSEGSTVTIYVPDEISIQAQIEAVKTLKNAFPALPMGFYDIMIDRMRANGFNEQRLMDAVANVIDTCVYPTPTIATLISWDRRVKLYTWAEVTDMIDKGAKMSDFIIREYNGEKFRILKTDAIKFGML
jgi:hypothetical protein